MFVLFQCRLEAKSYANTFFKQALPPLPKNKDVGGLCARPNLL